MQAERLGYALRDKKIDAIYSSPLQRAMDTAEAIAQYHNIKVNVERNLREIDAGEMEGVTLDHLITDFSHYLIQFNKGEGTGKLPGGESLQDLRERTWKVVRHILSKHQEMAVIVSHYFVTLSIICAALDLPVSSIKKMRVRPAGISVLSFIDNRVVLKVLNDTCHLNLAG
jgi:broad specificity phosphatase PhoE